MDGKTTAKLVRLHESLSEIHLTAHQMSADTLAALSLYRNLATLRISHPMGGEFLTEEEIQKVCPAITNLIIANENDMLQPTVSPPVGIPLPRRQPPTPPPLFLDSPQSPRRPLPPAKLLEKALPPSAWPLSVDDDGGRPHAPPQHRVIPISEERNQEAKRLSRVNWKKLTSRVAIINIFAKILRNIAAENPAIEDAILKDITLITARCGLAWTVALEIGHPTRVAIPEIQKLLCEMINKLKLTCVTFCSDEIPINALTDTAPTYSGVDLIKLRNCLIPSRRQLPSVQLPHLPRFHLDCAIQIVGCVTKPAPEQEDHPPQAADLLGNDNKEEA
jgi:hypothetical protein